MSDLINGAASLSDLKKMSKEDLAARLELYLQRERVRETLKGIHIEMVEGVSKKGNEFKRLKLSGGVFGGYGVSFTTEAWAFFTENYDLISSEMAALVGG